jgi:DNA-binding NtrC family response regulator
MQPSRAVATRRILCVVTAQDVCELIAVVLPDYEISTVRTIAEARLWLAETSFDLVVVGDSIFDGSTLEVCEMVHRHSPDLPIIVLAGRSGPMRSEIRQSGATDLVSYDSRSWPEELNRMVHELAPVPA